jgi:DNA adenine methylase
MVNSNPLVKPYLKWAGGKRQLLSEIRKHLPKDINSCTYYEPFVGAGAVFFDLQPEKAVINDFNKQLTITYNAIKENAEELIKLLENHKKKNNKEYYYKIRDIDRDEAMFSKLSNMEKAARLIYLNKTCFNGLYRVNSKGFFNVPYGKYKNPSIFNDIELHQISIYLKSSDIIILNGDFENAVSTACKNSFIYFDPPYHSPPDKKNFTKYQADDFNDKEQERLCNVIKKMTNKGVRCLLSNSDTEYIRELYSNNIFDVFSVQAKRMINSDSAGRGNVNEVLIKNWKD